MSYLYYPVAAVLAFILVVNTNAISSEDASLSAYKSAAERTDTIVKGWLEVVSFGLYEGAREKEQSIVVMEQLKFERALRVRAAAWALCGVTIVLLLTLGFQERQTATAGRRRMVAHLLGIAAIFLAIGLTTPILTVVAGGEVAMLGDVVLQHESKGIVTTFLSLFARREWFIGALLVFFSIVVPVVKLVASLCVLYSPTAEMSRGLMKAIRLAGKWSMTDVFVVAILLAFFAADANQLTDAKLEAGLYFFAAYGLLSLLATQLLLSLVDVTRSYR